MTWQTPEWEFHEHLLAIYTYDPEVEEKPEATYKFARRDGRADDSSCFLEIDKTSLSAEHSKHKCMRTQRSTLHAAKAIA